MQDTGRAVRPTVVKAENKNRVPLRYSQNEIRCYFSPTFRTPYPPPRGNIRRHWLINFTNRYEMRLAGY
jgi:hypothetical protein